MQLRGVCLEVFPLVLVAMAVVVVVAALAKNALAR
jgi:hypothetical protein